MGDAAGGRPRRALPSVHRLLAGTLFGAQVVVAGAVVPAYRRLDVGEYVRFHTLFTRYADAFLPLLGGLTTAVGYLRYRRDGRVVDLAGTAALVAAGAAGAHNLSINARVRAADLARSGGLPYEQGRLAAARDRWAVLHLVRVAGGLVAVLSALPDGGRRTGWGRPVRSAAPARLDPAAALVVLVVGRDVVRHLRMLRAVSAPSGSAPTDDAR